MVMRVVDMEADMVANMVVDKMVVMVVNMEVHCEPFTRWSTYRWTWMKKYDDG